MSCGENCTAAVKLEELNMQTQRQFNELLAYVKELSSIAALLQNSIADRDRRIKELEGRVAELSQPKNSGPPMFQESYFPPRAEVTVIPPSFTVCGPPSRMNAMPAPKFSFGAPSQSFQHPPSTFSTSVFQFGAAPPASSAQPPFSASGFRFGGASSAQPLFCSCQKK